MFILIYIAVFVIVGIVIGLVDKEVKFGLWVIVAISVLWGFVFGPWAIATFIELLVGYFIINHKYFDKEKAIDVSGKSFEWLQDEAEKGNPDAQYMLGEMFENNEYNPDCDDIDPDCPDIIMAIEWYSEAAQQGHVEAQFKYGKLLPIMKPNQHEKANHWMLKAAEQGHAEAQYSVGLNYSTEIGIPKEPEKGVYWLKKAAKQGHLKARELYE
jgi:TPR repeat protein